VLGGAGPHDGHHRQAERVRQPRVQVEVESRRRTREVGALANHDVAAIRELAIGLDHALVDLGARSLREHRLRLGVSQRVRRLRAVAAAHQLELRVGCRIRDYRAEEPDSLGACR
jgi:hypothetical protein